MNEQDELKPDSVMEESLASDDECVFDCDKHLMSSDTMKANSLMAN